MSKQSLSPEDLYHFQYISDPQMSPDGKKVLFVKKTAKGSKYDSNIWLVQGTERRFTSGGKDSQPRFSPDGEQVAFIREGQLFLMESQGGEAVQLTHFVEGDIDSFRWSPDGKKLGVTFMEKDEDWTKEAIEKRKEQKQSDPPRIINNLCYKRDGAGVFGDKRHALYIVEMPDGKTRCIYSKDTVGWFDFDFSPDGKKVVVAANRDKKGIARPWKTELLVIDVKSGKIAPVPHLPQGPKATVSWSPDGRKVAYLGREGKNDIYNWENLELFVCDPLKGGATSLTSSTDYCLMPNMIDDSGDGAFNARISWSPDNKRLYFLLGWHGEQHIASAEVASKKLHIHTKGPYRYQIGNLSADGKKMALTRSSVEALPEVFEAKVSAKFTPNPLTHCNEPQLKGKTKNVEVHWVPSTDGAQVQLFVMRPSSKKIGPAILQIHGGPHAQYGAGFFHEMQVLSEAGYTVFYANPRGSKGCGRDFAAAIAQKWGTEDWEDIQTIVAFMKKYPGVDTKRMGIMGGSYGGYMTNWVISHCHDFRAAITDRCVVNVVSHFGNSDIPSEPDICLPGNSWDKADAMWEQSPLKYFGNVKTPTLIIHSEGDFRCNVEQAQQMFTALQLQGVPSKMVLYPPNTSHGMSRQGPPDLRVHRLNEILAWWKRWL